MGQPLLGVSWRVRICCAYTPPARVRCSSWESEGHVTGVVPPYGSGLLPTDSGGPMTLDAWLTCIVPHAVLSLVSATEPIYIWQRNDCTMVRVWCVLQSRYASDSVMNALPPTRSASQLADAVLWQPTGAD